MGIASEFHALGSSKFAEGYMHLPKVTTYAQGGAVNPNIVKTIAETKGTAAADAFVKAAGSVKNLDDAAKLAGNKVGEGCLTSAKTGVKNIIDKVGKFCKGHKGLTVILAGLALFGGAQAAKKVAEKKAAAQQA